MQFVFQNGVPFGLRLDDDEDVLVAVRIVVQADQSPFRAYQSSVANYFPHLTNLFFVVGGPVKRIAIVVNPGDDDVSLPLFRIYVFQEQLLLGDDACLHVYLFLHLYLLLIYLVLGGHDGLLQLIQFLRRSLAAAPLSWTTSQHPHLP